MRHSKLTLHSSTTASAASRARRRLHAALREPREESVRGREHRPSAPGAAGRVGRQVRPQDPVPGRGHQHPERHRQPHGSVKSRVERWRRCTHFFI